MNETNGVGIPRKVCGILSGTSADSVDVVLTEINGSGKEMSVKVIDYSSFPISADLRSFIHDCSSENAVKIENICRLNYSLGNLFAECILRFIEEKAINKDSIDLIGSHGQTIYHFPHNENFFGYPSKSTLQLGEPSVIAKKTGITTVADFRSSDIAIGGDGAPLVPYMDYVLFSSDSDRILVNIGGIANLTFLKAGAVPEDVIAFDCGPGNMLIDALCKKLFSVDFDRDGEIALNSQVNNELYEKILSHDEYISKPYPKSTGREYYGRSFMQFILENSSGLSSGAIVATVSEFTVYGIYSAVQELTRGKEGVEVMISGGGADNKYIMKRLSELFSDFKISKLDSGGITHENKEAVLFAILAHETMNGVETNIPGVTGAERKTILGKICPAV